MLTMGWIEGVKLTNKEGMQQWGLNIIDFVNVRSKRFLLCVWEQDTRLLLGNENSSNIV